MRKKLSYILTIFALVSVASLSFFRGYADGDKNLSKTNVNDNYAYIAINQCFMWVSNNGDGSHDPRTDGSGFYWPGGENATIPAIFEDGLIFAGKIGREIRMNGNTHRQGLQAGVIKEDGTPDDPSKDEYKIYKIRKGWELLPPGDLKTNLKSDYENWPDHQGAPYIDVNNNDVFDPYVDDPFIGDEVLFYVANDMDPSRSTFTYGTLPMGLEFQTTIWAFNRAGDLGDIVFKKYKIINKGSNTIREMYLGFWSDTDLGFAGDDFTGCDSLLSLGYTYNGDENDDDNYGSPPPAIGYDFFQGPIVPYDVNKYPIIEKKDLPDSAKFSNAKGQPIWKKDYTNLPMTGFTFYINIAGTIYRDPQQGVAEGSVEFYNYLSGYIWNGEPFIDPHTTKETKIILAGDPVLGTGWYEGPGWPGGPDADDRRHLQASGPFTMSPGDTQEVVVGIIIARGSSSINSIAELKRKDLAAQIAYDLDFNLTDAPPAPKLHSRPQDHGVTLWWEPNAEDYDEFDPLIPEQLTFPDSVVIVDDTTYNFEGYRVWQFSDLAGSDPQLLAVYDIQNGIKDISSYVYDFVNVTGIDPDPVIQAPDDGIKRFIYLTYDAFTNTPFNNGSPYYFGVTAYGYSKWSDPPILESTPVVIEVRPSARSIGYTSEYLADEDVVATQISGDGDGRVTFKVVDPDGLTGKPYRVVINGDAVNDNLTYSLFRDDGNTLSNAMGTGDSLDAEGNPVNDYTILIDSSRIPKMPYSMSWIDTLKNWIKADSAGYEDFVNYNDYANKTKLSTAVFDSDTSSVIVMDGFIPIIENVGQNKINEVVTNHRVKGISEFANADGELSEPVDVYYRPQDTTVISSTGNWYVKSSKTGQFVFQKLPANEGLGFNTYEIRFTSTGSQYYLMNFIPGFTFVTKNDTMGRGTIPFEVWDLGNDVNSDTDDVRLTVKIVDYDGGNLERAIQDSMWSQTPSGVWESIYVYDASGSFSPDSMPARSGNSSEKDFKFGNFDFVGEIPDEGTVIRVSSWKPLQSGNSFELTLNSADFNDKTAARTNVDKISVFPNPYFGAHSLELGKYQRFMRFIGLPQEVTIRIFSLSGVFVRKLQKNDNSEYVDWDLLNADALPVASGIYIAYIDMPGIGTKTMKLAVIQEQQYIDRL
ncbi:MAG: hypothetical protein K9H48_14870 [Melioribacteraceae bacterium]|nr:hypothetical protein [Melioribacteraceae bacterium]MCF8393850.1 hypothetical protein [Melioribacteraceae bacterium]MCF8418223.1 hypothetical protein [Melioribacteraceae bacterium]